MNLQRALRNYLQQNFPGNVHTEPWCTCGSANHVRVLLFCVNGQPATAIVPEGCELSAAQLGRALPGVQVEPLSEAEIDEIYAESAPGSMQTAQPPFGAAVYLDKNLLRFTTLVFCPKMFSGRAGACFRVPTGDFRKIVNAKVVRMFPAFVPAR